MSRRSCPRIASRSTSAASSRPCLTSSTTSSWWTTPARDETAARASQAADARTVVLSLPENQGVGGAVLAGHAAALELGADVCVVMAGDGQMDPDYLPALLDPIASGRAQFTKANRFYGRGSFAGMPAMRVLGNVALSFFTKAASGYWNLFDPQNGYTAIHRDALERLPLNQIAKRYDFENDLLINLNILRVPAVDVPVPARYGTEVSGMNLATVGPRIATAALPGVLDADVVEVRPSVLLRCGAAVLQRIGPDVPGLAHRWCGSSSTRSARPSPRRERSFSASRLCSADCSCCSSQCCSTSRSPHRDPEPLSAPASRARRQCPERTGSVDEPRPPRRWRAPRADRRVRGARTPPRC